MSSIVNFNDIQGFLEVIIVDNSPNQDLKNRLDKFYFYVDLKYIHNKKNGGFGQGNNIGVMHSSGDILFFLNPDTILVEHIFDFIVNEFQSTSITVAGFKLIDRNGRVNHSVGLLPEYNYIFLPRKILNYFVIKFKILSNYIYPWGAALVVRKKDFIDAGMFDESMFICNEEPDLMHRLSINRIAIYDKHIIHLEGHTTEVHESRYNEWLKTSKYYLEKYDLSYKYFIVFEILRVSMKWIFKSITGRNCALERKVLMLLVDEIKRNN